MEQEIEALTAENQSLMWYKKNREQNRESEEIEKKEMERRVKQLEHENTEITLRMTQLQVLFLIVH